MGSSHPTEFKSLLDQALARLAQGGLKRTRPREVLLGLLIREHGPFSIDEISKRLSKEALDGVTVYRCMGAFEKIGLVRRCEFGDGISRYEYQGDESHHHHHVVCTRCKRTQSLADCQLTGLERLVKSLGYTQIRHSLEFFGLCASCSTA